MSDEEAEKLRKRAELAERVALSLLRPTKLIVQQMGCAPYQALVLDDAHRSLRSAWDSPEARKLVERLNTDAGERYEHANTTSD